MALILTLFFIDSKYTNNTNGWIQYQQFAATLTNSLFVQLNPLYIFYICPLLIHSRLDPDFYKNWLTFGRKDFISPIADSWKAFYNYELEEVAELVGEDLAQVEKLSSRSSKHRSTGDRETSRLKQVKPAEANSRSIHQNVKPASDSGVENPQVEKSRSRDHVTGIHSLELVQMLSRPGGIRQAFLLKEIIDRPLHRWK